MQTENLLQANNWKLHKLFTVIFSAQLALLGSILADSLNFPIPIVRQLVGFIFLTFVPGVLILRILKIHKLGNIESVLYSIGLSLSLLIFVGFSMNIIFPKIGISNPISFFPLFVTINIAVLILCILCYLVDKNDFCNPKITDFNILSYDFLILVLIILLCILGTCFVNFYHSNIILLAMFIFIAFVISCIFFNKLISVKLYPFAIWIIALSLIWHFSLISEYLTVNDVVNEFQFANLVIKNSFWNFNNTGNYNSVLSTVILAPIYFHICDLSLTWVFKIIYPLLFSFTSLGVYSIFLRATKDIKITFFSSFLFISVMPFMFKVPSITKQSTAEIFLVLLLMTIFNNYFDKTRKSSLLILFSFSLVVSHYATSYLFLFSFIYISLILFIINIMKSKNISIIDNPKFTWLNNFLLSVKNEQNITPTFLFTFIVFVFSWYLYVSNSSVIHSMFHIIGDIKYLIVNDFLSPDSSRGLYLITRDETSITRSFIKYSNMITELFIIVGFFKILLSHKKTNFSAIYLLYSSFFLIILFLAIFISGFAVIDPQRLYHLSLFTLAPFCIIGGLSISKTSMSILSKHFPIFENLYPYSLLSVFFVLFFLLNTGFVSEILKDHPVSYSISLESIPQYGNIDDKANYYGEVIMTQDVYSGRWLAAYTKDNTTVYRGDLVIDYPSLTIYGGIDGKRIKPFDNTTKLLGSGYAQLSYVNVVEGIGSIRNNLIQKRIAYSFADVYSLFNCSSCIYNNGGSKVMYIP